MVVGEKETRLLQRVAAAPIERAHPPCCGGNGADRVVPWSGQLCTVQPNMNERPPAGTRVATFIGGVS